MKAFMNDTNEAICSGYGRNITNEYLFCWRLYCLCIYSLWSGCNNVTWLPHTWLTLGNIVIVTYALLPSQTLKMKPCQLRLEPESTSPAISLAILTWNMPGKEVLLLLLGASWRHKIVWKHHWKSEMWGRKIPQCTSALCINLVNKLEPWSICKTNVRFQTDFTTSTSLQTVSYNSYSCKQATS